VNTDDARLDTDLLGELLTSSAGLLDLVALVRELREAGASGSITVTITFAP
jgi:hypothetical protein